MTAPCGFAAAISAYEKALSIDPNSVETRFNLSLVQLLTGQYSPGWKNYEIRFKTEEFRNFPKIPKVPKWTGVESLFRKKILVLSEQGFGDTIQFSRYIPFIIGLGAEAHLLVPPTLCSVIRTLTPTLTVHTSLTNIS